MAKKRILAHFMHEDEEAAAWEKMVNVEGTESYLFGEIEEEDLDFLKDRGLVIDILEDEIEEEPVVEEAELPEEIEAEPEIRGVDLEEIDEEIDEEKPNYYLIELGGPLLGKWRSELEALNVNLLEYIPHHTYTARLSPEQVRSVDGLNFVKKVRLYGPEESAPTETTRTAPLPPDTVGPPRGKAMLTFDIRLHQKEDMASVLQWLEDRAVDIAGASKRKIRLYLLEDSPLFDELNELPQVASIEEYVPPELHNQVARLLLGIDTQTGNDITSNISLTGEDQIVAVADTGLDENHPDFQGRISGIVALGREGDPTDPHGHGTHVAGSVLGNGTASGGEIRGTAPAAKLFFQSLLDSSGGLGGLPLDLGDLFEEAYQSGAHIHNNSWGAATQSMYTFNSIEVDEFIANRRDMLIVISAGNEGQAAERLHSQPGFVDWLSVGSPASSKNALTVGATRSSRTSGGIAHLTYDTVWPSKFPDPPIGQQNISGDPEALAAFSSRGPCDDHRIKPDLVAPGTDILSTKSSRAPLRNFWGPFSGSPHYAFMGGTSMAAPLVTGCAALVREYYLKERSHHPSAALLKATLINSTRWLSGDDAKADHEDTPNFHQGFGCLHMPWAIPNASVPALKLEFVDPWQDASGHFNRTGQRFRYRFSVSGGDWLRICLAWTDLPGRGLQNNLNLFLDNRAIGKKWVGNEKLPLALTRLDPDNNVEIIRVDNPPAGEYMIQISASNLLGVDQDYAFVVTGELSSTLVPV